MEIISEIISNVKLYYCPLFTQTFKEKQQQYSGLADKLKTFIKQKKNFPNQRLGSEKPTSGIFTDKIKGIQHVHLTEDISLWWRFAGSNPTRLELFGIFSHDESGTGQPSNNKRIKSVTKQMVNQIDQMKQEKPDDQKNFP